MSSVKLAGLNFGVVVTALVTIEWGVKLYSLLLLPTKLSYVEPG